MLNKTMIALTATVVLSFASSAFAYEDPENRIGDRYPLLEPTAASAVVRVAQSRLAIRQTTSINQVAYTDPENQIGDRYPFLAPISTEPRSASAGRYLAARYAANVSQSWTIVEDPENKVADRYPLLEQRTAARQVAGYLVSRRALTTGSIR